MFRILTFHRSDETVGSVFSLSGREVDRGGEGIRGSETLCPSHLSERGRV